jgi:hypothetical protein
MTERISAYAERDARADYQEHRRTNSVPKSTKAFRQHVERRVARFVREKGQEYQLSPASLASSYDHMYVTTYNELQRTDKVNLGDKVNWLQQHRGGYGYTTPVAGIVIGETARRVRIAVYNLRLQEIKEKLVYPASLTPRTNHTELDEAMEQARQDAAPFFGALQAK